MRNRGALDWVTAILCLACLLQVALVIALNGEDGSPHPHASWVKGLGLSTGKEGQSSQFISGTFFSRSGLAGILNGGGFLFLSLSIWGRYKTATKLLLFWIAGLAFFGVFISESRAGIVGAGGAGVFFLTISMIIALRSRFDAGRLLVGIGLCLTLLPVWIFFVLAKNSYSFSLVLQKLTSDPYREHLWFNIAPFIFKLEPWTGSGAGTFSLFSLRYRTPEFWGNPVYAHNDWLQLSLDYGLVGLAIGVSALCFHLINGAKNSLTIGREFQELGLFPQSRALGYFIGSASAIVAQSLQMFFDYSMNIPSVAWISALFLGICSSQVTRSREGETRAGYCRQVAFRSIICVGLIVLSCWVISVFSARWKSEQAVLNCENCEQSRPLEECLLLVEESLKEDPSHPRLSELKGRFSLSIGSQEKSIVRRIGLFRKALGGYRKALKQRPLDPSLLREYALSLSLTGNYDVALKVHNFAISRDPFNSLGYQYLATHYQIIGKRAEADRLMRIAQNLPGKK